MKICITCEKLFEEKKETQKACSRSCNAKHHNKELAKRFVCPRCPICGKETIRSSRAKYCSRKCQGVGRRGDRHPLWKGGVKQRNDGYVYIYKPEHPNHCNGYILEHRVIMENFIGRLLEKTEIVHHVNGKKDDNRIENLLLLENQAEHLAIHRFLKAFRRIRQSS